MRLVTAIKNRGSMLGALLKVGYAPTIGKRIYEPSTLRGRLTYFALNPLGILCSKLSGVFESWAYRLERCEHCGRSRFYGTACVFYEGQSEPIGHYRP